MPVVIALGTAFLLGLVHAIEVDHMIAVTAFVSTRPALRAAAGFGARWGLGHSLAVLAAGGLLLATGLRWPEGYDAIGEALVGLMLMAVGLWAMRRARKLHLHPPEEHGDHLHLHAHKGAEGAHGHHHHHDHDVPTHHGAPLLPNFPTSQPHRHPAPASQGITLVGMLHGLAGTSAVVALVPVTLMDQTAVGLGYLLAFGAGTMLAMTGYAVLAAVAMRQATEASVKLGQKLGAFVGVGSVVLGAWWVVRAVG
jgi:ABC-type nickel/cobalt efflux system permease component RcnA